MFITIELVATPAALKATESLFCIRPRLPLIHMHSAIEAQDSGGCCAANGVLYAAIRSLQRWPTALGRDVSTIVGVTSPLTRSTAPHLLLCIPVALPAREAFVAIIGSTCGGDRTTSARAATTPILLRYGPSPEPLREACVAIEPVTSLFLGHAAPRFLLVGPCSFPILQCCITIKGFSCGRVRTSYSSMLAAPRFLAIRPSFLPILQSSFAIKLIACTTIVKTTGNSLGAGPCCLPLLVVRIAIERGRGGWFTTNMPMSTAPSFLLY